MENIHEQIKRIDKLDAVEDSRVSIDPGEIDRYTETYITKVEELLKSLDASDLDPKQKDSIRQDLLNTFIAVVGPGELQTFEPSFRAKIDEYLGTIDNKVEKIAEINAIHELTQLQKQLDEENKKIGELGRTADVNKLIELIKQNSWLPEVGSVAANLAYQTYVPGVTGMLPSLFGTFDITSEQNEQVARDITTEAARINALDAPLQQLRIKIAAIQKKIVAAKQKVYVDAYSKVKSAGGQTDQILLAAYEDLGKDVPKEIKTEVEAACRRKIEDPNSIPFDKYFFAGRYAEAFVSLNSTPALTSRYGASYEDADLYRLYEKRAKVERKDSPVLGSMEDIVADRMKKNGSFGGRKLEQGYIVLSVPSGDTYQAGAIPIAEVVIGKKMPNGDLSIYFLDANGDNKSNERSRSFSTIVEDKVDTAPDGSIPVAIVGNRGEYIINKQSAQATADRSTEIHDNFPRIIGKIPSFCRLGAAAKTIQDNLTPLQKLFTAGRDGKMTKGFAQQAKKYALNIQGGSGAGVLGMLRANMPEVKRDLARLRELSAGYKDEFKVQIAQMEASFSQIISLVESGRLDYFCQQVLNPSFSEDTPKSWFIKEGMVIAAAIAFAVTAIVLTVGTGGVGGIAIASAVGTAAGMVGAEVGHIGSELIGEQVYGKGFSNKTMLGKYFAGEGMLDSKGKLKEIDGIDLIKTYGEQFVVGFLTTFALMGLGQLAGRALSRFAAKNLSVEGFRGDLAAIINKIPKLDAQKIDLLSKSGMKKLVHRLGHEYLQELGETSAEIAAQKAGEKFGGKLGAIGEFSVSFFNCLTPGRVKYMVGKTNVAAESIVETDFGVVGTFSYDANNAATITATIKKGYEANGFSVTSMDDGTIKCERKLAWEKGANDAVGSDYFGTVIFKPVKDSIAMRDLVGTGGTPDGRSEIVDLYGVNRVADNQYVFDTEKPGGKISITKYLQQHGFKITQNKDGAFIATKGNEVVEFKHIPKTDDTRTMRQEGRSIRRIKARARERDPRYAARVEHILSITDDVERRHILEKALDEHLSDEDWSVILDMHNQGGSGSENLVAKIRIAKAHTSRKKSPAEKAKWEDIYNYALEEGYAGSKQGVFGKLKDAIRGPAAALALVKEMKGRGRTDELEYIGQGKFAPDGSPMTDAKRLELARSHLEYLNTLDEIAKIDPGLARNLLDRNFDDTAASLKPLTLEEKHQLIKDEFSRLKTAPSIKMAEVDLMQSISRGGALSFVPGGKIYITTENNIAVAQIERRGNALFIISPDGGFQTQILPGQPIEWGRNTYNNLPDKVSGRHAEISYDGTELTVRDLNASNGTKVLGKELTSEGDIQKKEVVAIGDVNGSLETLAYNLRKTGVIDDMGKWAAGKRTVVLHGDILADRNMEGFDILLRLRQLRQEARAKGGDIKVIAGNHDDFMFSFLTQRDGVHKDGLSIAIKQAQGIGILEITQFTGDRRMITDLGEAMRAGRLNPQEALDNMRGDQRGRQILEEMVNMTLVERMGDTLYVHTDPTNDMLQMILQYGPEALNQSFQHALHETLLNGSPFNRNYNYMYDTFLSTKNRTIADAVEGKGLNLDSALLAQIKQNGINKIVFGHSVIGEENRKIAIGGIQFIAVDQGSLKDGHDTVSAAIVGPKGVKGAKTIYDRGGI